MNVNYLIRHTTSQKQIDANRRNAKLSTGPRTRRGRAVSSQNARKYDLLPDEDPALPVRLTAQYYAHYVPTSKKERTLVDTMLNSERAQLHCLAIETQARYDELSEFADGLPPGMATGPQETSGQIRSVGDAYASLTRRLTMVRCEFEIAQSAYRNARRQLESMRAKVAA
jgi:hypothetical protein